MAGHMVVPEIMEDIQQHQVRAHQEEHIANPINTSSRVHDLLCVGFGPASLAIGIALEDALPSLARSPDVLFLERQSQFAWHSGMQIPGAKMQISFLKDLATPRNCRSNFTFINYLHSKSRLNTFINLDTFLPSRKEYEDYLRWCAGHFERLGQVSYDQDVVSVTPQAPMEGGKVKQFRVLVRNKRTGQSTTYLARHVVIAVGGIPMLPTEFPSTSSRVIHSSKYNTQLSTALPTPDAPYHIAVVGNGQSAAEIFDNLPSRYPNAKITMIIKGSALRPSDDSPFVNEVFDPERVDGIYLQKADERQNAIVMDRATNYGVVRLGLLEKLYERLYMQRVSSEDPSSWQVRITPNRKVVGVVEDGEKLRLQLGKMSGNAEQTAAIETHTVDAVFVATGYVRNAHEEMLKGARTLLPSKYQATYTRMPVGRNYRISFDEAKVDESAGIWLQGCNESTHGLSDTLLSILAIRGGELINSIFGVQTAMESRVMAKL